jgi:hypothetical protein
VRRAWWGTIPNEGTGRVARVACRSEYRGHPMMLSACCTCTFLLSVHQSFFTRLRPAGTEQKAIEVGETGRGAGVDNN